MRKNLELNLDSFTIFTFIFITNFKSFTNTLFFVKEFIKKLVIFFTANRFQKWVFFFDRNIWDSFFVFVRSILLISNLAKDFIIISWNRKRRQIRTFYMSTFALFSSSFFECSFFFGNFRLLHDVAESINLTILIIFGFFSCLFDDSTHFQRRALAI